MKLDAVKEPFARAIRAVLGPIDYYAFYSMKVVSQSADGKKVDVASAGRVPGMQGIVLRNGVAGTICKVQPGAFVLIGWDGADPRLPFALAGWGGGETVTETEIDATTVYLGAKAGAQFVALATLVKSELQLVQAALISHTHSGVTAGVGSTGPSNSTYSAGDVAASNVKAK